jgi:hypothetical protein
MSVKDSMYPSFFMFSKIVSKMGFASARGRLTGWSFGKPHGLGDGIGTGAVHMGPEMVPVVAYRVGGIALGCPAVHKEGLVLAKRHRLASLLDDACASERIEDKIGILVGAFRREALACVERACLRAEEGEGAACLARRGPEPGAPLLDIHGVGEHGISCF